MQYHLPPMQNQSGFPNMIPQLNQGNAMRGIPPDLGQGMANRNYGMPPASYVGSAYPAVPGLQHPMAYPGGMMSPGVVSSSPGSGPFSGGKNNSPTSSLGKGSGGQIEGSYFCSCLALIY